MLDIYTIGADVLRKKAEPISAFDEELAALVEEMFSTMKLGKGIGLAGPQVGVGKRLFVMHIDGDKQRVFVNPEIIETSLDLSTYEEGCLSVPGVYSDLDRPAEIRIQAQNEKGRRFTMGAEGFLARVIQHELDHLDGVLFTDRMPEAARQRLLDQYRKRSKV